MEYVDQAVEYLRQGFGSVNDPKGLIIALAAVIFMDRGSSGCRSHSSL